MLSVSQVDNRLEYKRQVCTVAADSAASPGSITGPGSRCFDTVGCVTGKTSGP